METIEKQLDIINRAVKWWKDISNGTKTVLSFKYYKEDFTLLTSKEVEHIFNKENIHVLICENCKEYMWSSFKDKCKCGCNTFSQTDISNWKYIKSITK